MMPSCGAGAPGAARPGDEAIAAYAMLLNRYHRALDLMSPRGLGNLDQLLRDAEAYSDIVRACAPAGLVMDVGSGAGLPGVVIAARSPARPMMWVERRQRRATFLRMVAARASLEMVEVVSSDVRSVRLDALAAPLAAVTAQGVGGWADVYEWTRHLHGAAITLVARRGGDWQQEVAAFAERLQASVDVRDTVRLEGGGTLVALLVRGGLPCP